MSINEEIVRLTYKQLKEMAERNNSEEVTAAGVADGVHRLTVLWYLPTE